MVKPDNYVMLLGWMRTELNLKGNELNLYSIIYGFTQDGETEFSGSIRYMQEWLGVESKQTVFNTLDKLIKKGLVQKRTEVVNGIKHNYYLAAPRGSLKIRPPQSNFYTGVVQNLDHPSPNFRPNNKEDNIEEQNNLLKKAIEQKPDAILFSPSSMDASDELLKEAKEKGIRITYIDSYTKEELQDLTVATDNVNAGRMLGEYARKLIDKDSKIAIVSHVKGVSTAVEREQGFREGLGDYADNIVDIVYCNSLYEKSYELAQELMRKYPDLELIAGMNEYSAVGVGRAVSDAGAKDKIAVVGVDCSQEAINLMEMGVYKGIIVQKAFRMGYIGVEETIHMLNGDAVEKILIQDASWLRRRICITVILNG